MNLYYIVSLALLALGASYVVVLAGNWIMHAQMNYVLDRDRTKSYPSLFYRIPILTTRSVRLYDFKQDEDYKKRFGYRYAYEPSELAFYMWNVFWVSGLIALTWPVALPALAWYGVLRATRSAFRFKKKVDKHRHDDEGKVKYD